MGSQRGGCSAEAYGRRWIGNGPGPPWRRPTPVAASPRPVLQTIEIVHAPQHQAVTFPSPALQLSPAQVGGGPGGPPLAAVNASLAAPHAASMAAYAHYGPQALILQAAAAAAAAPPAHGSPLARALAEHRHQQQTWTLAQQLQQQRRLDQKQQR